MWLDEKKYATEKEKEYITNIIVLAKEIYPDPVARERFLGAGYGINAMSKRQMQEQKAS